MVLCMFYCISKQKNSPSLKFTFAFASQSPGNLPDSLL
jgi:hypothetical protein